MARKIGRYTVEFENEIYIKGFAAVCGKKESEGPLAKSFDKIFEDTTLDEKTWEKAESKLQMESVKMAVEKSKLSLNEIDYIFAGDLLNQCISSSFGLMELNIPFLGQYGACSTMAQTLIMAATAVESGVAKNAIAVTSSHFCSAERQYRFPLQYGGQRTPTAQWTVTGSGACVVCSGDKNNIPKIKKATVGRILSMGIKDINNMGAAMAPAAYQTLKNYFEDTNTSPKDYDLILTGDLGEVGTTLLKKLMYRDGIDISENHKDCGLMIYDKEKQDVHAGGSGCGCSASVLCSIILNNIKNAKFKNVLFMATGAMMSPTSSQQGETIPAIAHLINIGS